MLIVAEPNVPSSAPLLFLSEALLFQVITVFDVWFLAPMKEMYGLELGTTTLSLHIEQNPYSKLKRYSYYYTKNLSNYLPLRTNMIITSYK